MIAPPPGVHVWLACGHTDMRKGFDGLAALAQKQLGKDPFSGQLFAFRGKRGDLVKVLSWDGQGLCLYAKRLEKGHFVWPHQAFRSPWLTPTKRRAGEGRRSVTDGGATIHAARRHRLACAGANMAAGDGGIVEKNT